MNIDKYIGSYKFCKKSNNNDQELDISRLEITKEIIKRYENRVKKDLKKT